MEIKDFQTWYDMEGFEDYYGPLLPERIQRQLDENRKKRGGRIEQ